MIRVVIALASVCIACGNKSDTKKKTSQAPAARVPAAIGKHVPLIEASDFRELTLAWHRHLAGLGSNVFYDAATADTGEVYISGYLSGEAKMGTFTHTAKEKDGLVVAISPAGETLWTTLCTGDGVIQAETVAVGKDAVYIGGSFDGEMTVGKGDPITAQGTDGFVAKLDRASGDVLWVQQTNGNAFETITDIAVRSDNSIVATGDYTGNLTMGKKQFKTAGFHDIFVMSLDQNGALLWAHDMGGPDRDHTHGVAIDKKGHTILFGNFTGRMGLFGKATKSQGNSDFFVLKLDALGEPLWSRFIGGQFNDFAGGLAVTQSGQIILTATYEDTIIIDGKKHKAKGKSDSLVMSMDPAGKVAWSQSFGGGGDDWAAAVATNAAGNIAVGGWFSESLVLGNKPLVSKGHTDLILMLWDRDGKPLWSKTLGDRDYDKVRGIALSDSDQVTAVGLFRLTMNVSDRVALTSVREEKDPLPKADGFILSFAKKTATDAPNKSPSSVDKTE